MLPPEVFNAARGGGLAALAAIQNWLEQGGNPNEGIEQAIEDMIPAGAMMGRRVSHNPGSTLLMAAASRERLDVVRLVVDAPRRP